MMVDAPFLYDLAPHGEALFEALQKVFAGQDAKKTALNQVLDQLPNIRPTAVVLDQDWVTIGRPDDLSSQESRRLIHVLTQLKPWRKGPFDLFGIRIDSEWNSALKWNRVAPHLAPLADRKVLDVGSSNGYYPEILSSD